MKTALERAVSARLAVAAAVALCAAACSGGGGGGANPAPAAPHAQNATSGSLRLTLDPDPASSANSRRPRFLSPSTQSVSIAVTGIAAPVVANVGTGAPDCTGTGSTRVCTIPLTAPAGTDTFTITLYDAANATGNVLGTGSVQQHVVSGFTVAIVVNGVLHAIAVTTAQSMFTRGTAATTAVTVTATDADGNTIAGTYASPITLALTDATGTFALSSTSVTTSGQSVTLTYSGAATPTAATITPTAAGIGAGNTTPQQLTVSAGSTAVRHLFASSESGAVSVYDIAADGSISGPSRTISGAATTLSDSQSLAVDSSGDLFVVNYGRDVTVYAPNASGNVAPIKVLASGIGALAVAVDPHDGIEVTGQLSGSNGTTTTIAFFNSLSAPTNPGAQTQSYSLQYAGRWATSPLVDTMGRPVVSCTPVVYPGNNGAGYENCFDAGYAVANGTPQTTFEFGVAQPNDNVFRSDGLLTIADGPIYGRGPSVDTYSLAATVAAGTQGNISLTPTYSITGGLTGFSNPYEIAFDGLGNMYVCDPGLASYQGTVKVFPINATGDVAPTRSITGLNENFGVAIGP